MALRKWERRIFLSWVGPSRRFQTGSISSYLCASNPNPHEEKTEKKKMTPTFSKKSSPSSPQERARCYFIALGLKDRLDERRPEGII